MKVSVQVAAREWYEGNSSDWEFFAAIEHEIDNKISLFRACQKEYGRCVRSIPMGWKFTRREIFPDGTKRLTEYTVLVSGDNVKVPVGFILEEKS